MSGRKLRRLLVVFIVLCVIGAWTSKTYAQGDPCTVLGLYCRWQSEGYPAEVSRAYYDYESEKLVVVLYADDETVRQQIGSMVTDPENMRFATAASVFDESDEVKRRNGVFALLLAYGVCALGLAAFLYFRAKDRKKKAGILSETTDKERHTSNHKNGFGGF